MSNPRIISGKARGVRLRMVPGDITRPVTDMVKEAFYNILGQDIAGASFIYLAGPARLGSRHSAAELLSAVSST
jgi:16S rRNA (guanine966-N2)-methyltransferase